MYFSQRKTSSMIPSNCVEVSLFQQNLFFRTLWYFFIFGFGNFTYLINFRDQKKICEKDRNFQSINRQRSKYTQKRIFSRYKKKPYFNPSSNLTSTRNQFLAPSPLLAHIFLNFYYPYPLVEYFAGISTQF